jgi:hypothetical protein
MEVKLASAQAITPLLSQVMSVARLLNRLIQSLEPPRPT